MNFSRHDPSLPDLPYPIFQSGESHGKDIDELVNELSIKFGYGIVINAMGPDEFRRVKLGTQKVESALTIVRIGQSGMDFHIQNETETYNEGKMKEIRYGTVLVLKV